MELSHSNFDKICRTCMTTNANPLQEIFHLKVQVLNNELELLEVLGAISTIEINPEDALPQGICLECIETLVQAYRFQKICAKADRCMRKALAIQLTAEQSMSLKLLLDELAADDQVETLNGSNTLKTEYTAVDCRNKINLLSSASDLPSSKEEVKLMDFEATTLNVRTNCKKENSDDSVDNCYNNEKEELEELERPTETSTHPTDIEMEKSNCCNFHSDCHMCKACGDSFTTLKPKNISVDNENKTDCPSSALDLPCTKDAVVLMVETDTSTVHKDYKEEHLGQNIDDFNNDDDQEEEEAKGSKEASTEQADVEIEKPNPRNRRSACHMCEVCGKSFDRMHRLSRHMNVHKADGRPHECRHCKRRFTKEALLKRHAITHENNFQERAEQQKQNPDGHKCPECPRKFLKQESLASHMRTHRKNADPAKSHTCDICSKVFTRLYRLTRHRKLHEENRKLSCDICGKTFGLSSHLIDHLNKHSGIKPHVCHFCDKSFLQACTLKDHLRTHTGEQPFLCSECGKAFNNASNLRQHQLRHTGIKRYQCPECPSKFTCKSGLSSHMSTHRNQKPYVCDICGSRFTKHYSLKKHERIHTGEKPYKCDYCDMRFICSDHMKRHRRTHTGEKPYACKYCNRSFAQSNDMIKHLRSHVGENVYKCEQCDESFRLSTELRRHMTEHYKVEKGRGNDAVPSTTSS